MVLEDNIYEKEKKPLGADFFYFDSFKLITQIFDQNSIYVDFELLKLIENPHNPLLHTVAPGQH